MTPMGWRVASRGLAGAILIGLLGCTTTQQTPASQAAKPPALASTAAGDAAASRPVVGLRRLTESQYRNTIADIFGDDIQVRGRFEQIQRPDQGLVAVGASGSAISAAGFEQYEQMGRGVAAQVLDPAHRTLFLPCAPRDPARADADCARAFFQKIGRYVFRRPLSANELTFYVQVAERATEPTGDFHTGLSLGLSAMLSSPRFLYRMERAEAGARELDAWSKASRLSYLLWNTTPDEALLDASGRGDLDTPQGLAREVDRLLASPRLENGLRAFFTDFMLLDRTQSVAKDPVVYPRFDQLVVKDLSEQTLRTLADLLLVQERPYPEVFTAQRTFLTRRLGVIYDVPVSSPTGWEAYEFDAGDDRAGLLGQAGFLALYSHEGRSSPTLRGKAIREVLLCQPVPPPPGNVDFSGFNDSGSVVLKTARERLNRHNTDPVCAGCHRITDPLGLPLERFDSTGAFRNNENGAKIDVSGTYEGQALEGASGMGLRLSKSRSPTDCVSRRLAEYATGREQEHGLPTAWVAALQERFAADGFRYRALLRDIATSPEFGAAPALPGLKTAAMGTSQGVRQ